MKLIILSLTIFLSIHNVLASEPVADVEVWRIGKLYYSFKKDEKTNALVTPDCLEKKEVCEAFKALLNKKNVSVSESERSGGKNPGAVICKKNYGGEIVILKNSADNENAFCKFKDKSIVSASNLY